MKKSPDVRGLSKSHQAKDTYLATLCDLFGIAKWPFEGVKWPPTRGWKGHFESPGSEFNVIIVLISSPLSSDFFLACKIRYDYASYNCFVVSTQLKNIRRIGSFPQIGMNIKVF